MNFAMRSSVFGFFLLAGSLVVGCKDSGPPVHPVKGVVMVKGKPAEHALVFMHRDGRDAMTDPLPYGKCIADGSFEIETPNVGKGALEGEYKITVFWPDMSKPEDGNGQRPDALYGAYDKVDRSKLTASVKSGENKLPTLDLVPGAPKAPPRPNPNDK